MADYDQDGKEVPRFKGIDYDDHRTVLDLLSAAQQADHDNRERAREAHLFVDKRDGQWEPYWWHKSEGKPRYTFDFVNPIIDQVVGEIQDADFDIKVSPAGGDATKDIARTYDGLIRNVENMSGASLIYASGVRNAATAGFDAWRVCSKFVDDDSFDQDLAIEPIPNAVDRVWFDPSAYLQDKSDSRYVFVLHPTAVEEYYSRWPDGSGMSVSDDREGEAYYDKATTIVTGEILYIKEEPRELVLMSNGSVYTVDDDFERVKDELALLGIEEVRRRQRPKRVVVSRYFDANGWLEKAKETPFSIVPVVPCYGNYKVFENKTIYWGVVEKLLDPQRVLNYSLSREIEEGALAPRAKYWMTQKQAEGFEDTLSTLNTNSDPVQFYNPDPEAPGAPQQTGGAQINPGLRTISEAMRSTINQAAGMFAANMGDNPHAQSGVAIERLQNKGDNGTSKYFKALEVAISATGRLLVDAAPKIYDNPRTVRILNEDGSFDMTVLNQEVQDRQTGRMVRLNDLSQGQYDVVCHAGPSFKNRQQETLEAIIKMAAIDPEIMQLAGDVVLKSVATPDADLIAERKRAQMVKAGIIPENQLTDEERAMLQQQQAQSQQANPALLLAMAEQTKAQAELTNAQTKAAEVQTKLLELQLRQQVEEGKLSVADAQNQIKAFQAQTDRMATQIDAQAAGAKVTLDTVRTQGVALDNAAKVSDLANPFRGIPGGTGVTR